MFAFSQGAVSQTCKAGLAQMRNILKTNANSTRRLDEDDHDALRVLTWRDLLSRVILLSDIMLEKLDSNTSRGAVCIRLPHGAI